MGLFSFMTARKSPVRITIPEPLNLTIQQPELLHQFSIEVGSPRSASGWVVPDSIISPASPVWQSQRYSFGGPPLRLRGGEIQDFEDCDLNSPTALERYLSWIDQDYYDEQFALRQTSHETQHTTQEVELDICGEPAARSVDDSNSDSDSEIDEFSHNTAGCLLATPDTSSSGPYAQLISEVHGDMSVTASFKIEDWLREITHDESPCPIPELPAPSTTTENKSTLVKIDNQGNTNNSEIRGINVSQGESGTNLQGSDRAEVPIRHCQFPTSDAQARPIAMSGPLNYNVV